MRLHRPGLQGRERQREQSHLVTECGHAPKVPMRPQSRCPVDLPLWTSTGTCERRWERRDAVEPTKGKITPEAFYQQLAQVGGPDLAAFSRVRAVDNAPAHGLTVRWGDAGPLLSFIHEGYRWHSTRSNGLPRSTWRLCVSAKCSMGHHLRYRDKNYGPSHQFLSQAAVGP